MLDRRTLLKSIPFLSAIPWGKTEVPAKPVAEPAAAPDPEFESFIGCQFTVTLGFKFPDGKIVSRPVTATIFSSGVESLRYSVCIPFDQQADIIGSALDLVTVDLFGKSQQFNPAYNTRPDGASDIVLDGWLARPTVQGVTR